ncbi:MAG: cupin domain-containing protein [Polyangia bacterium]
MSMPDTEWARFIEQDWQQRPVVLHSVLSRPLLDPDELFDLLHHIGTQARAGHPLVIRCYVDGAEVNGPRRAPFLPLRDDGSLAAYVERVTRAIDGRPFGIILNQATSHSTVLWRRARSFLRALYGAVGHPRGVSECGLFLGTYEETPFGIHSDEADVFVFSIERAKQMLLWPRSYFFKHEIPIVPTILGEDVLNDTAPFARDAIDLTCTPADVMYWPRDYWHVGVNSGERGLQASVSLGAYMSRAGPMFDDDLRALLLPSISKQPPPGLALRDVAAYVETTCADLREAAASNAAKRTLLGRWLASLSNAGLPPPPRCAFTADPEATFVVAEDALLIEHEAPGGGVLIAANGRYLHVEERDSPEAKALCARVRAGERFTLRGDPYALVRWLTEVRLLEADGSPDM